MLLFVEISPSALQQVTAAVVSSPWRPTKCQQIIAYELLEPLFRFLAAPLGDDTILLAYRLLMYLKSTLGRETLASAGARDALPFFWSYIDVDVDMMGWQDRFPFVDACVALWMVTREKMQGEEAASLMRAVRLARLLHSTDGDVRDAFLWPRSISICKSLEERISLDHSRRVHAVQCVLWRRYVPFLWATLAALLFPRGSEQIPKSR